MDPNNPIIKLCVEGMQAEAEDQADTARNLFMEAWASSQDDFEACIAAHYVARHQNSPEDTLGWNQEAVNRASQVADDRVQTFYPSLYLNLGHSHEVLGHLVEARRCYELAAAQLDALPPDGYFNLVRNGIAAGQQRVNLLIS